MDGVASPLFPPQHADNRSAKAAILDTVRRQPSHFGHAQTRWQLRSILESCSWLRLNTLPGLSRLLQRLGITYQRGRDYIHSPDPNYVAKREEIESIRKEVDKDPHRFVLLYLDEMGFYRQPTLSYAYAAAGEAQPLARRSLRSDTSSRILGALNAMTGRVHFRQASHINLRTLSSFWFDIRQAYPHAETIFVVIDNWPLHFHPDVLAPLMPQHFPYPPNLPANWPTSPSRSAKQDNLPIQLLCLPTYASWLNPIEKLWRWLRQDILHLHSLADDWVALKSAVTTFLDRFANGSTALLHYVGLLPI